MTFQRRKNFNPNALKFTHAGKRLSVVMMNMKQAGNKESVKMPHTDCLFQLLQFHVSVKVSACSGNLISQLFRKVIKLFFLLLQRATSILRSVNAAIKPCSFHAAPPFSQLA